MLNHDPEDESRKGLSSQDDKRMKAPSTLDRILRHFFATMCWLSAWLAAMQQSSTTSLSMGPLAAVPTLVLTCLDDLDPLTSAFLRRPSVTAHSYAPRTSGANHQAFLAAADAPLARLERHNMATACLHRYTKRKRVTGKILSPFDTAGGPPVSRTRHQRIMSPLL